MDKLLPVKKDIDTILWCGPAALSATTGLPVSQIMKAAQEVTGKKIVKGMTNAELCNTAWILGYNLVEVRSYSLVPVKNYGAQDQFGRYRYWEPSSRPTLAKYARENKADFATHAVIVNVTGHYVALYGRRFCDNHTKEPVFLAHSPKRRARVRRVFQVIKREGL